MREIKFRAKRLDNGEWSYGSGLLIADDFCVIDRDTEMYVDEKYEWAGNTHFFRVAGVMCDLETIGQYTGLKDKNGKEIYEGDILKHSYWDRVPLDVYQQGGKDEYIEEILVVKYRVESGRYCADSFTDIDMWICEDSEVIGNIYDNPELLTK